MVREPLKSA